MSRVAGPTVRISTCRTPQRETLSELHSYVRAPVSEKHWKLYQDLGKSDTNEGNTEIKAGAGLFVSEFGFGGLPEIEQNCLLFRQHGNEKLPAYRHHHKILKGLKESMAACEFDMIYNDVDSFCRESQAVQARGNLRQLEALLSNKNVSGYCIHAFTDGDWILGAGLIDHWQRPKLVYHAVAEANKMPSILCFPERRNLSEGDSVKFNIVLRGIMGEYLQRSSYPRAKPYSNLMSSNGPEKVTLCSLRPTYRAHYSKQDSILYQYVSTIAKAS